MFLRLFLINLVLGLVIERVTLGVRVYRARRRIRARLGL